MDPAPARRSMESDGEARSPCGSDSPAAGIPRQSASTSSYATRPRPHQRRSAAAGKARRRKSTDSLSSASSSSSSSSSFSSSTYSDYTSDLPFAPTTAVTSPANYGRYNAENENSLPLIRSVPHDNTKRRTRLPSMDYEVQKVVKSRRVDSLPASPSSSLRPEHKSRLLAMPSEIIDNILSHLAAHHLPAVLATCTLLRQHAMSDLHWLHHVQSNVPGQRLTTPGPCGSFRELYQAHDRVWFLPRYKIWFCDRDLMGKMLVVRFDPRRGCIEGYQLVAISTRSSYEFWAADNKVIIHGFEPSVKLHLDKPVIRFPLPDRQEDVSGATPDLQSRFASRPGANRYADEIPMALEDRQSAMFSNFLLTRPLDAEKADEKLAADYPYDNIWPPPTIPARHHVSGARSGQAVVDLSPEDRPRARSEASDQNFRIRQWMELAGTPAPPSLMGQAGGWAGMVQVLAGLNPASDIFGGGGVGVHIGEEVSTYSTLDPILYTPTATKPWRGIWVGDYSGHGCEFLLINQPDDAPATDAELGLVRRETESDHQWEERRAQTHTYRGRLEAIKLTGDPNVPRGEYTFVADDLGPDGYVGIATESPFGGARVVKSRGHVAATGFVGDKFIESQLILISPNRLAQYWLGFGHISYFERVDIDQFLTP